MFDPFANLDGRCAVAYYAGYNMRMQNAPREVNPFVEGSLLWDRWNAGYASADDEIYEREFA